MVPGEDLADLLQTSSSGTGWLIRFGGREDKLFGHIKPRKTRGRFLPLPALPLPAADQDRDRLRQLLTHPTTASDGRVGA
jgi:hypothetical protein